MFFVLNGYIPLYRVIKSLQFGLLCPGGYFVGGREETECLMNKRFVFLLEMEFGHKTRDFLSIKD